ncbi:hypothetical protein P7F60_06425 [Rhizobium sp. YJ-22]|uniref:hypothetical protein n=1 Tax=Rhizobium sp. YJ-22 TaxID=3037556 RepID=UPI002412A732|nr:hypothetical protein [Rhizobium sp. YJ-22]MDG3576012.1 hypothetical protein [Rhizobium sp. YJ-22]
MSISERFFVIGDGLEMREGVPATNEWRDSEMEEETQIERTANFAMADANVLGMLLSELADALKQRNLLNNEDIAGALLRAECRAEMADKIGEEDGDISGHHVAAAQITIDAWSRRLTLEPALDQLRTQQHAWLAAGRPGESPLEAERIVEEYPDDEE